MYEFCNHSYDKRCGTRCNKLAFSFLVIHHKIHTINLEHAYTFDRVHIFLPKDPVAAAYPIH
jgi:hypothetical protein